MADNPSSPHGLAALAISVSFVQALLKRELIDAATVEATLKDAGLYIQALCTECAPEVEREALQIVKQVWPEEPVVIDDAPTAAPTGQA